MELACKSVAIIFAVSAPKTWRKKRTLKIKKKIRSVSTYVFVVIIRDKAAHLRELQAPRAGDVVPLSSRSGFRLQPKERVVANALFDCEILSTFTGQL
jgi:hypothetical protein